MVQAAAGFGDVGAGQLAAGQVCFQRSALGGQLFHAGVDLLHLGAQRPGAVGDLVAQLTRLLAVLGAALFADAGRPAVAQGDFFSIFRPPADVPRAQPRPPAPNRNSGWWPFQPQPEVLVPPPQPKRQAPPEPEGIVYGSADAQRKFLDDFVAAWAKVMNLDRFDLA